jgi:hypothetical protein
MLSVRLGVRTVRFVLRAVRHQYLLQVDENSEGRFLNPVAAFGHAVSMRVWSLSANSGTSTCEMH